MTELTIDQALQQGVEAHKAGHFQEADRLYTAIIKAQPKHPDANHNMGVLAVGLGKGQLALPFFKTALEANPATAQFWLSYIDTLIKLDRLADAQTVFDQAKSNGAKGDGFDKLEQRLQEASEETLEAGKIAAEPQPKQPNILDSLKLDQAIKLAKKRAKDGSAEEAKRIYQDILAKFPKNKRASDGHQALVSKPTGKVPKVQDLPNDQLQPLMNLYSKGQLALVIEHAQVLTKQYPEAFAIWNLLGVSAAQIGQQDQAIYAFQRVLAIKPNNAEAHNNIGNMFQEQGQLEEAIKAFRNALAIKPDNANAYYNMGNALKDLGNLEQAIKAYTKSLEVSPDHADAHRHLSQMTKHKPNDRRVGHVKALLERPNLKASDQCQLYYAYAKMKEDLGELSVAFDNYVAGGALRQKLLAYDFAQDKQLFSTINNTALKLKNLTVSISNETKRLTPIFILGMPRSGTTLVEQIVSSHSEVTGAGELYYTSRFGSNLATGQTRPNAEAVQVFREGYLAELAKMADGRVFVTDKMPQNFYYIALIYAAFPNAKIIHVKRSSKATCWSNFKHYFSEKGLGYSYNLADTVSYYGLYKELMRFWNKSYRNRIYNLDYDKLTEEQEPETRRLIEHLGLNWEDTCLSPENNQRSVKTASQQQVRQKVYRGSSQTWRKYEPFLDDVFDRLKD